jgi:N6-L-threonylcarbamoyladenine synthase
VDSNGVVKGEALASSPITHEQFGGKIEEIVHQSDTFQGIKPDFAARDHKKYINDTIIKALGNTSIKDIDAIAVTVGPGLASCLRVGLQKAKELAIQWKKPIIPINHLEGHALVARMNRAEPIEFPFLLVLVSGGHSQILICKGVGEYLLLGGTVDDSLGEAFDKVARTLGFSFTEGGKSIETLALKGKIVYDLPIGMLKSKNCDLSFAGIILANQMLLKYFKV